MIFFGVFFPSQVDTPTSAFSLAWKLREVFHTKHQKSAAADITAVLGKTCAEWDYGFIMVHLEVSYDLG
jgi:CBS-domain-containing membrane protein